MSASPGANVGEMVQRSNSVALTGRVFSCLSNCSGSFHEVFHCHRGRRQYCTRLACSFYCCELQFRAGGSSCDDIAHSAHLAFGISRLFEMKAALPHVATIALCTLPRARQALVSEALAADLDILNEKPPAATISEAKNCAGTAKRWRFPPFLHVGSHSCWTAAIQSKIS